MSAFIGFTIVVVYVGILFVIGELFGFTKLEDE
jgi:hypothetical protein